MTRDELKGILDKYELYEPSSDSKAYHEMYIQINNAMVAAYNRGIDDSVKSIESEPDFDVVYIKRLKI